MQTKTNSQVSEIHPSSPFEKIGGYLLKQKTEYTTVLACVDEHDLQQLFVLRVHVTTADKVGPV